MIPKTYHIENGCHNCRHSVKDFSYYNCPCLCTFHSDVPKDPTKGIDYLTDNDMERLYSYSQRKKELCVQPFGKCDEWEMSGEDYERRKKIA